MIAFSYNAPPDIANSRVVHQLRDRTVWLDGADALYVFSPSLASKQRWHPNSLAPHRFPAS
jgi:hypothetical protein